MEYADKTLFIFVQCGENDIKITAEIGEMSPKSAVWRRGRDLYNSTTMNEFDGFGDYACIVASLPSTGGTISPAGVYYSNENNFFVAYTGRKPNLSEFPDYIAPSIVQSEYWTEYSNSHHENCPDCLEIDAIVSQKKSGKNQAQWKMITMLHYIYTMFETNA